MNVKKWALFNIMIMAPLCQGASDIYTPALPQIAKFFGMNHTWSQMTIIVYMFSYGIGQFFWGCFSDYRGRRPALLYGLCFAAVGFIMAPFSHSIGFLFLSRLIQGLGVATIGVNYKAIVIDRFNDDEIYHASSMTNSAWGLGPILAPYIGGYLTHWFQWQANFWFLLAYTLISIAFVAATLKESCAKPLDLPVMQLMSIYRSHIGSLPLWSGVTVLTSVYTQMLAFNLLAPFLVIKVLHYSIVFYGHLALALGVAFFLGTLINKRCLHYWQPHIICFVAIMLALLASLAMLILHFTNAFTLLSILVPCLLINLTVGMIFPNCVIRTQRLFSSHHGVTTAMIGVLMMLMTSLFTLLISLSSPTTMLPLAMWDLGLAMLCVICYSLLYRFSSKQ